MTLTFAEQTLKGHSGVSLHTRTTPVEQIATETSFLPKSPCFQEEPENTQLDSKPSH
jgi:hypothetical protein